MIYETQYNTIKSIQNKKTANEAKRNEIVMFFNFNVFVVKLTFKLYELPKAVDIIFKCFQIKIERKFT